MAYANCNTSKRAFSHLNAFERGQIQALHQENKSLQEIADVIGCHKSTVYRELKRGTVTQRNSDLTEYQAYFPGAGQAVYEKNRAHCGAKYKLADAADFIHFAVDKLQKKKWSPDSVCGHVEANGMFPNNRLSTKTLYNYIDAGLLPVKNIDLPLKIRRKTKKKRNRNHKKQLGKSIEERPARVEERKEFGHWEIDTVLGSRTKGNALLTLTERKTRQEHIEIIEAKSVCGVHQAIQKIKENYGSAFTTAFKTITADNGSEFSELALSINCEDIGIYYAHPYTSWERGTNERHNGLIRRFIPKGKSMDDIDETLVAYVEKWCNTLPRKILGYQTPEDLFMREMQTDDVA